MKKIKEKAETIREQEEATRVLAPQKHAAPAQHRPTSSSLSSESREQVSSRE
jgi:hypothetical protein